MGKLVKKNGKLLKKGGKLVKTDDPSKCSCCGDGLCPPGKFCTWVPPDPCSTGKCRPEIVSDSPPIPSQCGSAPYDCTSEEACNQWYQNNPNPLCECWFCEDGKLVNRPAYNKDCTDQGGYTNKPDAEANCKPPTKYICAQAVCDAGKGKCGWQAVTNNGVLSWNGGLVNCQQFGCDQGVMCASPDRPPTPDDGTIFTDCVSNQKVCITEEQFNKGGYVKVSGPYDSQDECNLACNPPPPKECCRENVTIFSPKGECYEGQDLSEFGLSGWRVVGCSTSGLPTISAVRCREGAPACSDLSTPPNVIGTYIVSWSVGGNGCDKCSDGSCRQFGQPCPPDNPLP